MLHLHQICIFHPAETKKLHLEPEKAGESHRCFDERVSGGGAASRLNDVGFIP